MRTERVSLISVVAFLAAVPICAQTHSQPGTGEAETAPANSASFRSISSAAEKISYRFEEGSAPQRASWISSAESRFLSTETPFASDVTIQLATLMRGRVELGGFHRLSADENIYLGLPGGGAAPAWTVTLASHPALWSRAAVESGGFTIAFHPHASRNSEPAVQALRRLSRMAESACHSN